MEAHGSVLPLATVQCPRCWKTFQVTVDPSAGEQDLVEDCHTCCHPVRLRLGVDETGEPVVLEVADAGE